MACKTTFSKRRPARRGFSLVELLVSLGVGFLLMNAVAAFSLYTSRTFASMSNYIDLESASRNALDLLTRDVRQVRALSSFQTNTMVFLDADKQLLQYTYNPKVRTLTRSKAGESRVLLRECDELVFRMYQRNPVPGTFDLVTTTNAYLCKAIDVSWVCSRLIVGCKLNTESVQMARVIIRKQQ
jgi:Tfp pilus assembly protein PilW